ncbi:sortase domain-bontaining protein [Candidatus Enterococcus clewellii]|uniref:Sortase n=1 Tax=Candidatus Enterococcus clewellii TaxID=1834193 RepID=A0A242KCF4_9ENTE|nr:sortase [Enterococcus sp. 9E7_DIV0242]OTP18854.1 hypothetical protein A5888_000668 [Enterococcus sp. 9E7_DIV0242]
MKKRTWTLLLPIGVAVLLSGAAFFDHTIAAENTEMIQSTVEEMASQEKTGASATETSSSEAKKASTESTRNSTESEDSVAPEPVSAEVSAPVEAAPVAEEPAIEPVATPAETEVISNDLTAEQPAAAAETSTAQAYQAMTLYIAGQAIPYQNGGTGSGQGIIDSNPNGVAATWGGAPIQSGDDGLNTHIIGHNPGAFSALFSVGGGSQIVVTDSAGTPTTYTVQSVMQVDDYGKEIGSGQDVWDLTVGTGGGERITLQTCINDDVNLFVLAYK